MFFVLFLLSVCQILNVQATTLPSRLVPRQSYNPVIGQYWPNYKSQTAVEQPSAKLLFYFVAPTTPTGLDWPAAASTAEFIRVANVRRAWPLISIGGWLGSKYFSDLCSTDQKRTNFARQIADYLASTGFRGVDIDWEYMGREANPGNIHSPSDTQNFLLFLQILRPMIGNKFITAAVSAALFTGSDGRPVSEVSQFANYFDYLNLMTYDFTGQWSSMTGPNAPLYSCGGGDSVHGAVSNWINAGFPASKILLGIPSYALGFTTTSFNYNGGQPSLYQTKTSPSGTCGNSNCMYQDLISQGLLSSDGSQGLNGFTRYWDSCTNTPYLFNPQQKNIISYDDISSVSRKAAYARSRGLGGVFLFDSVGFAPAPAIYNAMRSALNGGPISDPPPPSMTSTMSTIRTSTTTSTMRTSTTSTRTTTSSTSTSTTSTRSSTSATLAVATTTAAAQLNASPSPKPTPNVSGKSGAAILCNNSSRWQYCTQGRCAPSMDTPIGTTCFKGKLYFSDALP